MHFVQEPACYSRPLNLLIDLFLVCAPFLKTVKGIFFFFFASVHHNIKSVHYARIASQQKRLNDSSANCFFHE